MTRLTPPLLFPIALLAACSQPLPVANNTSAVAANGTEDVPPSEGDMVPDAAEANAATAAAHDAAPATSDTYLGRWIGVEGMYLTVSAKPGGGVTIDNQWDLDHRGSFAGSVTADGLRFIRNGVAVTAVRSDGDATGLKWLAGKTDCLTVAPGEGYCRDRQR